MPINHFLISAAKNYKSRNIAVILSGTGSDGTVGCQAIHEANGLVLAQSPETAEFTSMPDSVIRADIAHLTLEPQQFWKYIDRFDGDFNKLLQTAQADLDDLKSLSEIIPGDYEPLFKILDNIYKIDFSNYKIASVSRRINRRMLQCEIDTIEQYIKLLSTDPDETDHLYKDLLIGVTEFFRTRTIYAVLEEEVLKQTLTASNKAPEFRVWIAGCASGEEAYSIAILADEISRAQGYKGKISIFATDIHERLLKARCRWHIQSSNSQEP